MQYILIFVVLNSMKTFVNTKLINEEFVRDKILQCIQDVPQSVDGRVINLLGTFDVRDIDFWLQIESNYQQQFPNDTIDRQVECLNGFAGVKRGQKAFILKLFDSICSNEELPKKKINVARCMHAVALLPHDKISITGIEKLLSICDKILLSYNSQLILIQQQYQSQQFQKDRDQLKIIELINILQGIVSVEGASPDTINAIFKLLLQQKSLFSERFLVSIFEIYGKIDVARFDLDLRAEILTQLQEKYDKLPISSLGQIVNSLRVKGEVLVIKNLGDLALANTQNPLPIDMIRFLQTNSIGQRQRGQGPQVRNQEPTLQGGPQLQILILHIHIHQQFISNFKKK